MTMPMGPTEEAAYALDSGVNRSDLSMAAQLEYDRMVAADEAYRTSAGRPLTKEERKQARRESHEELRRKLKVAEEITWLPNLGVAVRDGNVYQHGADRGESGFDALASRERRDPAQLRLLGSLAGAHAEVLAGKTQRRRRSGGERAGDVVALAPLIGPFALLAATSRAGTGLAVVTFADGTVREKEFKDKPSLLKAQGEAVRFNALSAEAGPKEVTGPSGDGVAVELERLAALHASGALDDEEFRQAKARIIGS